MGQDTDRVQEQRYASFRRRFRAYLLDALVLSAVLIASMGALGQVANEQSVNFGILAALAAFGLAYEPLLVSLYGGTLGHRWSNIRVIDVRTAGRLPVGRALVRALVKGMFGLPSFVFMLLTRRSQALHDLVAGSAVTIRNPDLAAPRDYFLPIADTQHRATVSQKRRVAVIVLYGVVLFAVTGVWGSTFVSELCLDDDVCSLGEHAAMLLGGGLLTLGSGAIIVLGWRGRLLGCRSPKSA